MISGEAADWMGGRTGWMKKSWHRCGNVFCMQNGREEQMAVLGFYRKEAEFSEDLCKEILMEWEDAPYVQKEALESFLEHAEAFLSQEKRKEQG